VARPDESDPYLEVVADPLHRRNARLYLIGLGASVLGNNAMSLVSGIWVKSLTGSSTLAGLVSVCVYAPSLAGPLAGVVADRVRRRRWLLALNVISAVVMVSLLAVRSRQTVWIIFAVMTWYGIELVLSSPAEDALFAEMLPLEQRQRSNGWRLGLQETGRLIAPLCGAGLFVLAGGGSVAILDAVTFLVAALMISRIHFHEATPPPSSKNWRVEIVAGLSHVWRTVELRRVLVASSVVMGVSGLLVAAQYSLVQSIHEPPSFLGVLTAGLGGGSVVASLLSSRLLRRVGERWLAVFGMVDFAVGSVLRAMGTLPTAVAGSIVLGFALPWVFLAVLNLAQRRTPISLQGRVSAAVTLVFFGPQAPLQAIGALAIRYVTYGQLYLGSAGVALASAAWLSWTAMPRHRVA
jgi:MFS family permease